MKATLFAVGCMALLGTASEHYTFVLPLQLSRFCVYSFQHTRLLAFKLPVTLFIFVAEIDGELQMPTMNTAVGPNRTRTDAEQALPGRDLV